MNDLIPLNDLAKSYLTTLAQHTDCALDDQSAVTAPACDHCGGVGSVRDNRDLGPFQPAALVSCPVCRGADEAMLRRCWAIGDLERDDPRAPTLDRFQLVDGGEPACAAMLTATRAWLASSSSWLVLHGNGRVYGDDSPGQDLRTGGGKSHLAEAAARVLLGQGRSCLFITPRRLFAYLGAIRRGDDDPDYDARLRWVTALPYLVIDDLGTESSSDFTKQVRFQLLNDRYQAATRGRGGATLITSNYHPDVWPDRLRSRANDAQFQQVLASPIDVRQFEID